MDYDSFCTLLLPGRIFSRSFDIDGCALSLLASPPSLQFPWLIVVYRCASAIEVPVNESELFPNAAFLKQGLIHVHPPKNNSKHNQHDTTQVEYIYIKRVQHDNKYIEKSEPRQIIRTIPVTGNSPNDLRQQSKTFGISEKEPFPLLSTVITQLASRLHMS